MITLIECYMNKWLLHNLVLRKLLIHSLAVDQIISARLSLVDDSAFFQVALIALCEMTQYIHYDATSCCL